MRSAALLVLVGCSYSPGSFSYPGHHFPGQRVTLGCLDISVDRRKDLDATTDGHGNDAVVLDYRFGNRCDDPIVIDLLRVAVIGRTVDGEEIRLNAYDPKLEMIATKMDARTAGGEAIAYPTTEALAQVCADVAAIGGFPEPRWLCFSSPKPVDNPEPPEPADEPSTIAATEETP